MYIIFNFLFVGFLSCASAMDSFPLEDDELNFESKHQGDELVSSTNKRLKTVTPEFVVERAEFVHEINGIYNFSMGTSTSNKARKNRSLKVRVTSPTERYTTVTPDDVNEFFSNNSLETISPKILDGTQMLPSKKGVIWADNLHVTVTPEVDIFDDEDSSSDMEEYCPANYATVSPEDGDDLSKEDDLLNEADFKEMESELINEFNSLTFIPGRAESCQNPTPFLCGDEEDEVDF
ncbi:MAG: hypothetical protein K2W94_01280 [Alphaproteobacteria bacterium]|nr:hypothetical protein [Alphaproteobacteria bacterium]